MNVKLKYVRRMNENFDDHAGGFWENAAAGNAVSRRNLAEKEGIQSFLGFPKVFSGQTLGSDFRVRFSGLTFGLNFRVWKGLQGADDLSAPSCQFSAFISRASSLLRWGLERDGLFRVA